LRPTDGKRLELVKEMLPKARVGFFWDPTSTGMKIRSTRSRPRPGIEITLQSLEVRNPKELMALRL
jgi:hypothetical protein